MERVRKRSARKQREKRGERGDRALEWAPRREGRGKERRNGVNGNQKPTIR